MLFKRKLFSKIEPYLTHKNAIVITGARQVGKTSLMKYVQSKYKKEDTLWFDLENPLHQKFFEKEDYDEIYKVLLREGLSKEEGVVFIDEIQNFPEITRIMKYLIDHYKVKFIVTGSSSYYMKNLFPESLSGRKFLFSLHPLDFEEFLYFRGQLEDISVTKELIFTRRTELEYQKYKVEYEEYLDFGGFPEVVLTVDRSTKKAILENVFKSFFEQDILQLSDYQNVRELRDLLLLLMKRCGSKIDVSKLASLMGVERYKIYSYLSYLEATFVIKLLPQWSKSIDRQVASGKKLYFIDTGFVNQLGEINEGARLENTVIHQLADYGELSFYQDKKSKELDVIIDGKVALEIKYKATKEDVQNTKVLAENIGIKSWGVVSKSYTDTDRVIYPQFL